MSSGAIKEYEVTIIHRFTDGSLAAAKKNAEMVATILRGTYKMPFEVKSVKRAKVSK